MPREEEASEEADTLPAEDDRLVAALHGATKLDLRHLIFTSLKWLKLFIYDSAQPPAPLTLSTEPFNPHFKQHLPLLSRQHS